MGAVVVVLITAGLGAFPPAAAWFEPHPGTHIGCRVGDRLRLELERVIPTDLRIPPGSVVAEADSVFVALDHSGAIRWFGRDPNVDGLDTHRVFSGLTPFSHGLLAFTDRSLFVLEAPDAVWTELEVSPEPYEIRSLVGSRGSRTIWIVTGGADSALIHRAVPDPEGLQHYSVTESWQLAGTWRLAPLEEASALALASRSPLEIRRLTAGVGARRIGILDESDRYPRWSDSAASVVSGVVPLNCDRAMVTVADMRSNARWLFLVEVGNGRVVRATALEATMGFFEAWPDQHEIFAYRATRGGGEMLVYRWSWVAGEPGARSRIEDVGGKP